MGVEATHSIQQADVWSTNTMLKPVQAKFDLHPEHVVADTAYGTGPVLGWRVDRKIAQHVPAFDKAGRLTVHCPAQTSLGTPGAIITSVLKPIYCSKPPLQRQTQTSARRAP